MLKFKITAATFRKTVKNNIVSLDCKDEKDQKFELNSLEFGEYLKLDFNKIYTLEIKEQV